MLEDRACVSTDIRAVDENAARPVATKLLFWWLVCVRGVAVGYMGVRFRSGLIGSRLRFYRAHCLACFQRFYARADLRHHCNVNVGPWSGTSNHWFENMVLEITFGPRFGTVHDGLAGVTGRMHAQKKRIYT